MTIFAVTRAGTTPTFLVINAQVDTFTVSVSTRAAFTGFFSARGKGTAEPRTLHIFGDATCGTAG